MFVLAVGNEKGGCGKTTAAVSIAVAAEADGIPVVIIDVDPQATASFWRDTRTAETPACVASPVSRLPKLIEAAKANGAGLVIVDGQPTAKDAFFEVAELADYVLMPMRATAFDLHSSVKALAIAKRASAPVGVVLNMVATPVPPEVADAEAAIRQLGVELVPVRLHQRVAHQRSQQMGQTAQEIEPGGRAADEIKALWGFVKGKMMVTA